MVRRFPFLDDESLFPGFCHDFTVTITVPIGRGPCVGSTVDSGERCGVDTDGCDESK